MPSYEDEVAEKTFSGKFQNIVFDETAKMEFINMHTLPADLSEERLEHSVIFGRQNSFIMYMY